MALAAHARCIIEIGTNISATSAVQQVGTDVRTVSAVCLPAGTTAGAILAGHAVSTTTLLAALIARRSGIDARPNATNLTRLAGMAASATI